MKNKILYAALLIGALQAGCKKQLDQQPISQVSTTTFFTNTTDFTQAVNGIYSDLRTYPDRQLNLSETRSDNLYAVSDGGVRDWDPVNDFAKTLSNNPYVSEAWNTDFNGIYRANIVLEQLSTNGTVITDATIRARFQAEARYLRALYYFDLVRYFGKLPLVDHAVTAAEALTIPRSSVADVYKLIIADLQYAGDNLPTTYAATDKGRATKYAAKSLLALVYMTRSGPTYSIEGPGLGLDEWSLALPLLNEVINSGLYSFLPSYSNIFSYTNENNAEVIFDVEYVSGLTPVVGATFPWLLVPDAYFNSLGKTNQGGLFIRPVSNNLLTSYGTTDTRKNTSVRTGYTYIGTSETRSFFTKYLDITKVPTNRLDWPINFIVMRYTDVMLLKAECILHGATGTQANVDAIVNQVRGRAGLPALSNVTLAQLMEERRKEFAAEGSRWHDLVRSGLVTTVMPAWIAADDMLKQIQPFQANYVIYPIPQSEIDAAPGLYTQNAGY
ncbi:MAG: RagB/SusD family nutrient uptake outer membrane protein [Janthinobacterium lividum]